MWPLNKRTSYCPQDGPEKIGEHGLHAIPLAIRGRISSCRERPNLAKKDSPMTDKDFVKEVYILADGNPAPNVAKFTFTSALGSCSATTRIRLSKTQNVHLLAAYSNGKFAITKSKVKVTIGGCGG